jgi:hypothetical protein
MGGSPARPAVFRDGSPLSLRCLRSPPGGSLTSSTRLVRRAGLRGLVKCGGWPRERLGLDITPAPRGRRPGRGGQDGEIRTGHRRGRLRRADLEHAYLPRLRQRLVQECAGLADPAGGPEAAVPDQQASRPGVSGRRHPGPAGGQLDGLPRPGPAGLERPAGPAGAESWRTFDSDGRLADEMVGTQMRELGAEVVRAARQFARADGEHDARVGRRPPDRGLRPSPGALVSGRPPRPPGPAAPWS